MHARVCGPSFKQSVVDAMATEGVIGVEARAELEKLRTRLMLSEEDGKRLFNSAYSSKIVPMVASLVEEVERKQVSE